MIIKRDYLANKFFAGKKQRSLDEYETTLCHLFVTLGYEETLKLPIPVFISIIKHINKQNEKDGTDKRS